MLFTKTKFLLTLTSPAQPLSSPIVTQLDHFLKLSRRKQTIYYKLLDLSINPSIQKLDLQLHTSYIAKDFNLLLFEQLQLIKQIDDITYNRNLFYTLFVRMMEILDQTKHRFKNKELWAVIDEEKKGITEFYSQQLASGKYEIVPMIRLETQGANNRVKKMLMEFSKGVGKGSRNSIPKEKSGVEGEKEKEPVKVREIKLGSPAKNPKEQKEGKWFKEFKEFGVQRTRQFTKQAPRPSNEFSLTSKTIELSFRPPKLQQPIPKPKSKGTINKIFNKLYKPIDVKLDVIEEKKEIIRVTLERLMEKNKEIQKEIGGYSMGFEEKRKGKEKEKEFRIKVKSVGCAI